MAEDKKPFHQRVAEECIEALRNGTAPWITPWEPGQMPGSPVNALTGKAYRGINRIMLAMQQGSHIDPRWCTYKQAQELGAQVKKGEKGTTVQYWKFQEERLLKDEQGKPLLGEDGQKRYSVAELERPRTFYATVFHASQIENLPPLPERATEPQAEWERHQAAERLLAASNAKIFNDQVMRAYYQPSRDEIHLPPQGQFTSPDKYYATALHELGHWSGHESRLDRDIQHPFGSEGYAREELRAEIASYMLGADLGIGHDPGQHHAYVASWIKVLEQDPREIIRAAQDAERLRGYVMGLEREHSLLAAGQELAGQISRRDFNAPERVAVQEETIMAVTHNPEQFFDRYQALEQSYGGRFINSDLFKETIPQYAASKESRNLYNTPVHNTAAVLAAEQFKRVLAQEAEPGKDAVYLVTGIPGAGKSTSLQQVPPDAHAVYEGQLADPRVAQEKVQQVLDAGFKPVLVAVHVQPEQALNNALDRFEKIGRPVSIEAQARIQGGLPEGLAAVRDQFGDQAELHVIDRRDFTQPSVMVGWEHLNTLESEGNYEHIKERLAKHLEQRKPELSEAAWRQASGLTPAGIDTTQARGGTDDLNYEEAQRSGIPGRSGEAPVLAEKKTWLNVRQTELGQDQGAGRGEEHYSATSVKAWPNDFPVVYTHTSIAAMKGSYKGADAAQDAADYEAAKQHGDIEAARRLVAKRINPEHLERMVADLRERGISPDEVIVAPVLEKEQGKNVIPRVLAEHTAKALNMRFDDRIVDVSHATHTGKETINRLLDRKSFEGPVEKNGKYLLVDDVLTQGGTLHELRHYLANNNAEAVGAVTLAFSRYSSTMEHRNTLSIQADTISELEQRYGRNELEEFLEDYNISGKIEALSEGEGRFLLGKKFQNIDDLDDAIKNAGGKKSAEAAKARISQAETGSEPDVAGGAGGIQGVERGAQQTDASGQAPSDDVSDPRAERPGKTGHYQSITALFGSDALYPEEADAPAVFPLASPVNPRDLAAVFPNAQISPLPDGYQVSVGKLSFGVHSVEQITPDTSLFAVTYGREPKADERIAGAVRSGEILIADFLGNKNTIRHESWHLLEDMNMVTPEERDILNHAALKAVQAGELPNITPQAEPVELRAWYVEQQLALREFDRATPEGRVLQKVADFVDSLANLARRTERGILRDVETGKLFEREPGAQRDNTEHYSAVVPAPNLASEKTWLNVPYKEKNAAKEVGAKWDGREKRWYAPEGADLNKLATWLPGKEQEPVASPAVLDPREEFSQTLLDAGFKLESYPVMDGTIHRVAVMGGKPGAKDGAYCGYEDGRPNGWYQNHKTGQQGKWVANGHMLSETAKTELRKESAEHVATAEAERQEQQEKAMKRAYAKWTNANAEVAQEHPYLNEKGIAAVGVRQDKQGNLVVPGFDLETGRIQTVEYINQAGAKWYEKGCPKKGAMAILPDKEALKDAEVVLMVEGYATGVSVHQATGLPVAVAFDAGNIKDAARAIKQKMPNARITICADNDPPRPDGTNIGVMRAKEAAAAVPGCKVVVADFSQDEKSRGLSDFNDLHKARGLAAVKNAIFTEPEKIRETEEVER